jgi:uncharacterized protein
LKEVSLKPDVCGRLVEAANGSTFSEPPMSEKYAVLYWRHRNDGIDFVLERKGKVVGLEVKSGATQKALGIEAFKKQHEPDKILLVGNGGMSWQENESITISIIYLEAWVFRIFSKIKW